MSQFDFPRIHFSGKTLIDPATGNNNYHYPLVAFEPLSGTAVMPPRIYFKSKTEMESIIGLESEFSEVAIEVESGHLYYLEITEIDNALKFKTWMKTPLGQSEFDQRWNDIYKSIKTEKEGKVLFGLCPAYWNYYGTMNFTLESVKIHSIQVANDVKPFTQSNESNPEYINEVLASSIYFENEFGKRNATMIDVSPTLSIFSQVFADRFVIEKKGKRVLEGRPIKASLRQMSPTRLVNVKGIMSSSGTFYTSIDLDAISHEHRELLDLMQLYKDSGKELLGLYIRYDLFGVEEDQSPDYKELGERSNPATSRVLGTISPLYKGDLKSAPFARLLMPKELISKGIKVGSGFANYNKHTKLLSLDLIGSLPLFKRQNQFGDFEMLEDAKFHIGILDKDEEFHLLHTLQFGGNSPGFVEFQKIGGIYDFTGFDQTSLDLLEGEGVLCIRYESISAPINSVLQEKPFHIVSDQGGLYSEEGDSTELGYINNGRDREKCKINIKRFGRIYQDPLRMMIVKLSVLPYGSGERLRVLDDVWIQNGSNYVMSTNDYGQFFYAFYPYEHNVFPTDVKSYMIDSGAFINLRVLKRYHWKDYISQNKVDFELIYNEILLDYDLIYPASGIITPFNQPNFQRIKRFLNMIMSEEYWHSYMYMPSSRDLSRGKKELLFKWLDDHIDP
jgi:hypothetical protein